MGILGLLIYICFGLIQCAAIFAGFAYSFGKFFGFIFALVFGELPIIGSIMAIIGAMKGWGWSLWQALLLFIFPLLFNFVVGYFMSKRK